MVSKDISGEPILILGIADVKILHAILDLPETNDQTRVVTKVLAFINDPECLAWKQHED